MFFNAIFASFEPGPQGTGEFALNLCLAILGGLLIGLEREIKGKSAGLKTNALVAVGAAVFIMVSLKFYSSDKIDPTRVIGQVVTGIGFLGAGVILKRHNEISGLTTAATVWCSAAVGCLAAIELYAELLIFVLAVVFINLIFGLIDHLIGKVKKRN
ncbi:MgtC/SapB family protein [Flavobacteriaceae bacterium F08102]|nr:MgtC/SapB family protein [Flavobacteriaceae bacterium F08102]